MMCLGNDATSDAMLATAGTFRVSAATVKRLSESSAAIRRRLVDRASNRYGRALRVSPSRRQEFRQ